MVAGISVAGYNGTWIVTGVSVSNGQTTVTYTDSVSGLSPGTGGTSTALTDVYTLIFSNVSLNAGAADQFQLLENGTNEGTVTWTANLTQLENSH